MIYLQKPFLLSFMPLTRLNIRYALASLTLFLHAQTRSLYSSQDTCCCFQLLYASFSHLILVRSLLFIFTGLPPPLSDFLHFGMGQWRRWSLKIRQFSWTPLQGHIPWDSTKQIPEQAKVCSPEVKSCDPAFCLVLCSQGSELHHHYGQGCLWSSHL